MEALTAAKPKVVVLYQQKDITADITKSLIDVTYTDFIEGESDSLEMTVEDIERRWQSAWYPTHGDQLGVSIGYEGAALLPCGDFEVDEIELDGPPDVVRIKGLAAGVKVSIRTRQGRAYDDTTLQDVAAIIAWRNGLRLSGIIEKVKIKRVTQVYETDLTFLTRLSRAYGYAFSVRGKKLVFFKMADIKKADAALTLSRQDVISFRFRDKVRGVAASATVSYYDPRTKKLRRKKINDVKNSAHSADEVKVNVRAEDDTQAALKATAALERANDDQTAASLTMIGNVRAMAGINVTLSGFGKMNGKYTITRSRHHFSRSGGYTTEVELKRVREPGAKS